MIRLLIFGKRADDDLLKTEKKKASSNDNLSGAALKLYSNNYQGAFDALNALRKHKHLANSSDFKLLNAYYLINTSQYKEASEILSELSQPKIKCDQALLWHMKVTLLINQRLFDEARIFLSKVERTEQVSLKLIFCFLQLKDPQSVKNIIKDDKLNFPDSWLYYKLYSLILKKNYSKALQFLENPDENSKEDMLILKGYLHLHLGQFSQSCQILTEVLESNNKSETSWHLLSIVYYKLELYSDCFWTISKCLHFHPESPEYLHNLSKLYEKTQNFSVAKGLCDKVKNIDPNFNFQDEFVFPILDFSEFGNRRKYFIPVKVACKEQIFVKPVAKKASAPKKKRKKTEVEEEKAIEFNAAWTLESMKNSTMPCSLGVDKGKKKGFMPISLANS